jgi:hypothetical protein
VYYGAILESTKQNLALLEVPNALATVNLPQTIREAIAVTDFFGERYNWIDALCIIQDSDKDKRQQIVHMDKIFTSAKLTIIVGDDDNVDAGFWESHERVPQ